MKKIFTASWGQLEGPFSNLGDKLIFETLISELKKLHIKKIYCYSSDKKYTDKKYGVSSENPFSLLGAVKIIRNIIQSDLVLLGGGELVQTKSSFLYLFANLFPAIISIFCNKKCIAIGVGISNVEEISKIGKTLSKVVLNQINCICVRDQQSMRNAQRLCLKKEKLILTADLVFLRRESKDYSDSKTVLFCPRFTNFRKGSFLPVSISKRFYHKEYYKLFDESAFLYAKMLNTLPEKRTIMFIPFYSGKNFSSDDVKFAERIYYFLHKKRNIQIIKSALEVDQLFKIINDSYLTIGTPLHSLISTVIVNKPIVSLSYSSKCQNFMQEMDMTGYVFDIEKIVETGIDLSELFNKIDSHYNEIRDHIGTQLKLLEKRSKLNISTIQTCF